MKNIHIIATDKPSRLFIIDKSKMFLSEPPHLSFSTVGGKVHKIEGSELYQPQNIYITNDEEIKEGDWYCSPSRITSKHNGTEMLPDNWNKIILTTDQDLIKDGVQAIDDEFLEWFVNNSSCEKVEIEVVYETGNIHQNDGFDNYKIIIPKEERERGITITIVMKKRDAYVCVCDGSCTGPEDCVPIIKSK